MVFQPQNCSFHFTLETGHFPYKLASKIMPKPLPNVDRILVIQLKHLGDLLLSTPVIDALAGRFASAKISVLVNSGMESMVTGNPRLAEIISFPPLMRDESGLQRLRLEWDLIRKIR